VNAATETKGAQPRWRSGRVVVIQMAANGLGAEVWARVSGRILVERRTEEVLDLFND
jgi:hypothetical protein